MEPILQKLGYTKGTVGQRMKALGEDPRYQFPENDAGRREIIKLMEDKIGYMRSQMPRAFRRIVPAKLEIRRLPAAEEAGAPNAYGGAGSIDGSIPGKVWVNRKDGLHAVPVKLGITDRRFTEIVGGALKAGDEVVIEQELSQEEIAKKGMKFRMND